MRGLGLKVERLALPSEAAHGTFVAPTLIEIRALSELRREVFGPVLHVLRYRRDDLDALVDAINATGYGLTFGLHTRLDETGGACDGAGEGGQSLRQPQRHRRGGGRPALRRAGPVGHRAEGGGPLYLGRLVARAPVPVREGLPRTDEALIDFARWLEERGHAADGAAARDMAERSGLGLVRELAGPVGETNLYALHPRGRVLVAPQTEEGLRRLVAAALATGNSVVVDEASGLRSALSGLPPSVAARVSWSANWAASGPFAGALVEGDGARVQGVNARIAELDGPLVLVQAATTQALQDDREAICLNWLVEEVSTSVNTAAAGGNASLMTIG